ncbi:MAG: TolC family protein, partial [Tidjanibacter sp.]|nr:TolC family protein [Tidjanibacter sp.]
MIIKSLIKSLVLSLALLAVGGCAVTLPQTAGVEIPDEYIFATTEEMEALTDEWSVWWEQLGDTTLNRLITTALRNNRNIAVARSRVEQAREQMSIARAAHLPSFGAAIEGGATYPKDKPHYIGQAYSIGATMSWELPLFGNARLTEEAQLNSYLATEWGYRATMLSLTAQVATTYFEWLQYARSLEIVRRSYALRLEAQQKIDSLHTYGFSSGLDLEQARSLTATAAADIPAYERSLVQTNLALNILLGETPALIASAPQWEVSLPAVVEVGIPSDLLERRPDLMESWHSLNAAAAEAGLARLNRLPSVPLTASGDIAATALRDLFKGNPFNWSASLSITEPIFNFGRLRRAERVALENYRQAALSYEQSFLSALAEVENALVAIKSYAAQQVWVESIVESNRKASILTDRLYFDGMTDYLNVIEAERSLYSSQL